MSALIHKHCVYRKLKSFQMAQLMYDATVHFVERYIDRFSGTRDQMVSLFIFTRQSSRPQAPPRNPHR